MEIFELDDNVRAKLIICQSLDGTDGYEYEVSDLFGFMQSSWQSFELLMKLLTDSATRTDHIGKMYPDGASELLLGVRNFLVQQQKVEVCWSK